MDKPDKSDNSSSSPSSDLKANPKSLPSSDSQDKSSSSFLSYKNWLKGKLTDKYSSTKEKINAKYQKSLKKLKNYKEKANEKYSGQLNKFGKYKKSINEKYQKRKEDINLYIKGTKYLLPFTYLMYQRDKFLNSYSFSVRLGVFGGSAIFLARYCKSLTLMLMLSFFGGFFLIPDISGSKFNR
ncbi:hypothetical protein SteCoe_17338 [Stentor coeruleus]|uniref:Uncharacterized protein n=1 Tax=Stentor coeruleus TaxID=5963 RepID=A0A1R2BZ71_9CILI|nr:hypothetical protein SteCoe_17338 [Stentor coeruleus]